MTAPDELEETFQECKNARPGTLAWYMRDWVMPLIAGVRVRDAALRAERARVAALESAARIDIDAANAECAARDCKAWISRGGPCDQCPCVTVSSISDALGVALCSVQKVENYAEAQP